MVHGLRPPTEAMMAPDKFGPNQMQAFFVRMFEDLLPRWMPKPSVRQFEGGDIQIGHLPLNPEHPAFSVHKSASGGHWMVHNYAGVETTSHLDPFTAIKEVMKYYANGTVDEWISFNYACSA